MVGHSFQNYDIVYVGFSAEYTCLYLLRTGFYPIYTTISIAYIHLIHKWRNARKSLGQVHESEAKGASDSNENKAEYGSASSISCNS